ncbi:hypothetical protein [Enterococcus sp. ZJ1622]|uniref:hypothetical protein n=1 Tax=Enterococcus sp. ZJ1622 TaxID=2709401 RepID=UPI0013EAA9AD|nr:hypothetical protein [Enterococcus sp. ZJ1622]
MNVHGELIIRLGVNIFMISLGIKVYDLLLKNKYGHLFLMQSGLYISMILVWSSMDLLGGIYMSGKSDTWLIFPLIFTSLLKAVGVVLVYSDRLNCLLSLLSYLLLAILLYWRMKGKKVVIQQTSLIKLPDKKISIYLSEKDFNYLFLWYVLTAVLVSYFYDQFIFQWEKLSRQVMVPLGFLTIILEATLTVYYFIFLSQLTENKRFAQLMIERERYKDVYQLIQRLLLEKKVRMKGEDVTEELCRWVSYGVFQVFGTDNLKKVKPDEAILLRLSLNARIFFSNEQTILETGVIVSDGGMIGRIS